MAIELGDGMSRTTRLTRDQIEQVARRMNAPEGQVVVFSRHGVLLHTHAEQQGTLAFHDEIYSTRRVGSTIEFERITGDLPLAMGHDAGVVTHVLAG